MRSAILLFALAAPSAFAATTFTNPLSHQPRAEKPREISLTFTAATGQMRGIRVNGNYYRLEMGQNVRLSVPVGSTVQLVALQDSRLDGTVLMQVTEGDAGRVVRVQ